MRVLHCIAQLPTRTGSGVYYRNLIREIGEQTDWEQAGVYALNADQNNEFPIPGGEFPVIFETTTLPFPIAGMSDQMPYRHTIYHSMTEEMMNKWKKAFREELLRAKETFRPDVVMVHHLWILASLVLEVFPDTPVFGISHGTDIRQAKQHPHLLKEHVHGLQALQEVFALSVFDKADLLKLYPLGDDQVTVTGGAYDPSVFYPKKKLDKRAPVRLVYAGKIVESKGVPELLEAYSRARGSDSSMTLDLIGRCDESLYHVVRSFLEKDPSIRLYDVASQVELAEVLRSSDLFVFPSYFEGLGLIALEALACGLHLVSNRLPGLSAQLGSTLGSHPVIRFVDLPPLNGLDSIREEAREDYVESLAEAISQQVMLIRTKETEHPYDLIKENSWKGLSRVIIDHMKRMNHDTTCR